MENKPFTKESLSVMKPLFGAITTKFSLGIAKVLAIGAAKYGRDNWKKCPKDKLDLYWDALYRHLNAYQSGELVDAETGESHLSHAACQYNVHTRTK